MSEAGSGLSVGIGLTNDCNLNCAHCYRPQDGIYELTLEQIRIVCENLPVSTMGLGTGENALHPQFSQIVDYLRGQGIKLTMASNGYGLNSISDDLLRAFHDVEVSIDFPTVREQDLFRGRGNWADVHRAMERCRTMGVPVSILCTLMNTNFDRVDELVALARSQEASLRVNVYQSVNTHRFALSYQQFWEGYRRLFGAGRLVSCSEPVVRAALGMGPAQSPCGHSSVRITPDGRVIPCVYWPGGSLGVEDLSLLGPGILEALDFQMARQVPPSVADCLCQGGCGSRRALSGEMDRHDEYCPWVRGDQIDLTVELAPGRDLLRASNVCTTIVE
ncbi:MAG TPA: radical SAM protein [Chloroflexi bacterium]|nr:radical SAM protein [Chloroflexota bacterium]